MTRFFAPPGFSLCIAVLLGLAFASPAVGQRQRPRPRNEQLREKAAPPKEPGKLEQFVLELQAEVEQTWPKTRAWPRRTANYAPDGKIELTADEVLDALGRRLHKDPAMDGYLKWQLLSFRPDIAKADGSQLKKILANLPAVLPQPNPDFSEPKATGDAVSFGLKDQSPAYMPRISPMNAARGLYRVDPRASAVSSGGGVTGKQTTVNADLRDRKKQTQQVLDGSAQLKVLQEIIDTLNAPSLGYRDAIIEKLPQAGGLKMAASYVDLDDRLRAGDRSYPDAAERFIAEVNFASDHGLADRGTRKTILNKMKHLYRVRLEFFRDIEVRDINRFRVEVEKVQLDEDDFKEAFVALQK